MRALRALRWALLLAVLGVGVTSAAIAAPLAREAARARPAHRARSCAHRRAHHRCRKRAAAKRLKHPATPAPARAPSEPAGATTGAGGALGAPPAAVGPGTAGAPASPSAPGGEAPTGEAPGSPAPPAHVEVTAEDTQAFRFVLSRPSVPAGKVIIEFINHGQDEHNMHVVEGAEGDEQGALANTAPDAHPSLALELRPGSYTFFCSIPGHEAAGMKATLAVN